MKYILSGILAFILTGLSLAGDWTRFRGPNGSGISPEKDLPTVWSDNNNIRWKAKLPGRGLSNPIVCNGQVYVTAASGWNQNRLHVLSFSEKSGKLLWERQFWATGGTQSHPKTNMAAPTPVSDGKNVYALFSTQDLVALDSTGNLLWYRSLKGDYPTIGNNVGMASSPVLHNGKLFVALENVGESYALAIDAYSGKNIWKKPRNRQINWVTPLVYAGDQTSQVIFQSPGEMTAYDAASGRQLWEIKGKGFSKIPSPIHAKDVIFTQGKEFLAIRVDDRNKPEVIWKQRKLRCGYSSPLYFQGKVYTLTTQGILRCADALSGEIIEDLRLQGPFAASPVLADGNLYLVNEEGKTTVVQVDPKLKFVAVNSLDDKFLATPVIANGNIYLRSDDYLYCIGKK